LDKLLNYKPFALFIILLCLGMVKYAYAYAQAPVISPKPQPVILHLDSTGYYKVDPYDIASITNGTDSALHLKINPASFNCTTKGKNVVSLTAFDNGTPPKPTPENVSLDLPVGVTFDPSGNMFISENEGACVRKVTPDGTVTKFAGSGQGGYVDGVGTNAAFTSPHGITCDSLGNLYLVDGGSAGLGYYPSIRKITPAGVVSTIYTGDYFVSPFGIAIDKKGILYITDEIDNFVGMIKPGDKFPTTLAGRRAEGGYVDGVSEIAQLNGPRGITIDDAGNVYVCENPNYAIRKITPDGTVSTFAGTGHSKAVDDPDINTLLAPFDVKISSSGYFYLSDWVHILRISPDGKDKTVICNDSRLNGILMVIDKCDNIYLSDNNSTIQKVTPAGVFSTVIGTGYRGHVNGNVGPFACQITTVPIDVNVLSTPAITSVFKDVVLTNCSNLADYTIKATATDNCPGIIKFTQTPAPNIPLSNNTSVKVIVTATDETGATASTSFNVDTRYVGSPPGRSVSVTASSAQICEGTPVTFTANVINGDVGTSYQWLVNGANTGPNDPVFTTSNLKDGDIINCAVTTGGGCGIPNTGFDIKMTVGPYPTISLNPSEKILAGTSVQLNPTVTGNIASYVWTPATGLSDPYSPNPLASPTETTTYQLKVTTDIGCDATAGVTVNVTHQINIPNAFTPNGDGINDLWNIAYLSNYTKCTVNIYDRYGSLVFQSIGYGKPWNGTYNGKKAPVGEYYYVIDLKDGSKPRAGGVTVLR